ncbi:MAG: phenylalanine--tRNA ligase subunit beta [Gammaproteobacteria bacterium]
MKISERWLRDWVDPDIGVEELAEQLTMIGLTVDAVEAIRPAFSGVVVARVLEVAPHPNADKLRVCRVDPGAGDPLTVVCGAANVRAGMVAAFAAPGAVLGQGKAIGTARLRGVESAGMLCSAAELGLAQTSEGLIELPPDAPLGVPLDAFLGLHDHVLDVDVTPNRGDCLSIAGIAREVAVRNRIGLNAPAAQVVDAAVADELVVHLESPAACPRYAGRVIRGVSPQAATPIWMAERLRRCGLRPLGPLVDITNYVMLELGQPLHAFDLDTIRGAIHVRAARADERLQLLDEQWVTLDPDMLVIADDERAIALAGIMGGLTTSVTGATCNVFLECAWFAPAAMAGRARSLKLQTDASQRFERGVSFELQSQAIERASALIATICGGSTGPTRITTAGAALPGREPVMLRRQRLSRLLGYGIEDAEVERILDGLDMSAVPAADGWQVKPPPARFDINLEPDLIEEVARHHGYAMIPGSLPLTRMHLGEATEARVPVSALRTCLVERGYHEVVNYSFTDPRRQALIDPGAPGLALANPISEELSVMRTTLWPGLLQVADHNLKRQCDRIRVFEVGTVFRPGSEPGIRETAVLAGAIAGARYPRQWALRQESVDFHDVRADIEALFEISGEAGRLAFAALQDAVLHPGQAATILSHGRPVGRCGAIHPLLARQLDLDRAVFVFELALESIVASQPPVFKMISKFPAVRRDLAFSVGSEVPVGDLLATVRTLAGSLLSQLELFDVYTGEGIDSGKKSVAAGLIFQDASSTLTEGQVNAVVDRVREGLERVHGAVLRS